MTDRGQTSPTHDIHLGVEAVTRDGTTLGQVALVEGGSLRIEPPGGAPFWLAASEIEEATTDRVRLSFDSGQLEQHRRSSSSSGDGQVDTQGANHELRTKTDDSKPSYLRPGGTGHSGSPD